LLTRGNRLGAPEAGALAQAALSEMNLLMTCETGGNEIVLCVRSAVTAITNVVDLQIGSGAAKLAAAFVAFEDL
jgi:hypothetical protein